MQLQNSPLQHSPLQGSPLRYSPLQYSPLQLAPTAAAHQVSCSSLQGSHCRYGSRCTCLVHICVQSGVLHARALWTYVYSLHCYMHRPCDVCVQSGVLYAQALWTYVYIQSAKRRRITQTLSCPALAQYSALYSACQVNDKTVWLSPHM